jgi:hypothetical protein
MSETGSTPITPLEGKTTIDDKMFFEPDRLSYECADDIAYQIAGQIGEAVKNNVVVIAGTSLLADLTNLQAVYVELDSLRHDYEALATHADSLFTRRFLRPEGLEKFRLLRPEIDKSEVPVLGLLGAISAVTAPASAFLGTTLGLISLFREDVEYRGSKTAVDPLAFELALASKLRACEAAKVFVPDLVAFPLADAAIGSVRARLSDVQKAKAAAWEAAGPLVTELLRLDSQLEQAATDKNQELLDRLSIEGSNLRRDLQPVSDLLARTDQRLASLQDQWNQVSEPSGLTLLSRLLRAEAIYAMRALFVHAQVVSSGGHHRISRNLFRTLFMGDGLSFSGGAIARWALLDGDGSVMKGGILSGRRSEKFLNP